MIRKLYIVTRSGAKGDDFLVYSEQFPIFVPPRVYLGPELTLLAGEVPAAAPEPASHPGTDLNATAGR